MIPQDIAQQMEGCLDVIRRYAPSTTSGNPPLPDPQRLRNVAETLLDVVETIERERTLESDEVPGLTLTESELSVSGTEEPLPGINPI